MGFIGVQERAEWNRATGGNLSFLDSGSPEEEGGGGGGGGRRRREEKEKKKEEEAK